MIWLFFEHKRTGSASRDFLERSAHLIQNMLHFLLFSTKKTGNLVSEGAKCVSTRLILLIATEIEQKGLESRLILLNATEIEQKG